MLSYAKLKNSIDLLDIKSLTTISSFNIPNEHISCIKKLNNGKIILGKKSGVFEIKLINKNQIILEFILISKKDDDIFSITNINEFEDGSLIFFVKSYIYEYEVNIFKDYF